MLARLWVDKAATMKLKHSSKHLQKQEGNMAHHGLSKSRIAAWRQYPKRLWLQIHKSELLEISDAAERSFQIGYQTEWLCEATKFHH